MTSFLWKRSLGLSTTELPWILDFGQGTPAYIIPQTQPRLIHLREIQLPTTPFPIRKLMSRAGKSWPKAKIRILKPSTETPAPTHPPHLYPRPEYYFLSVLPSSAFLGKEKSSPGGRQAGGRAGMLIHQLPAALVTRGLGPEQPRLGVPAQPMGAAAKLPWQSHTRPCCSPVLSQHRAAPMLAPALLLSLPARHVLGLCLIQPGSRQGYGARAPSPGLSKVKKVAPLGQRPESGQGPSQS
jgi:hypothetical protein